jgi:hypothetical protein
VAGEHDDWEDYKASMQRERRVIVQVQPRQAGPDRRG